MKPGFVTGGSSGIGLAAARLMAESGRDIALFARDEKRLADAKQDILFASPGVTVCTYPVDVSDRVAIFQAVDAAIAELGTPGLAIASAGIATPGLFTEQPLDLHEEHMAINYFGALYFTHAVTGPMKTAEAGQIGLISSGAAFFGIYGYGAYAPSKFALRGLAEVLQVELDPMGIGITLCYPPDTDTPQFVAEKRTKPRATQKITEGGGLWSADGVAKALLDGMERNQFIVAPGVQMKALNRLTSLIAPVLRWHQRRIIRKEAL
ncbi:3-dehydrosphinganine reductase [Shimia gijangensis]|uniref:3-dehydrosphinganine reductase n=1 Tax=Shimia gijangensis TaxID=1470563 RepID=A0A1M6JSV1_9RHOB|nr:SDR family oxidoreductase [Shimia gijangensis]SHJ49692.1 3-dehydrosphinganine reductase [Shimia gijangensis]